MAKPPLTAKQQQALDEEIEANYTVIDQDDDNFPVKLSEQIEAGLDDSEMGMEVLRRGKGRKTSFLFELDEFEDLGELQSKLRDEYGGGSFVIRGRRSNGQMAFNHGLDIEKPLNKNDSSNQQNNNTGNFESVLLAMSESAQRQSNETRDMMMQMQTQNMAAAQQNMTMVVEMMKANKPEAAAPPMGMAEMMAMMVSMKELNKQPEVQNPMELFLQGMEMGKDTASGADKSILQSAIDSFGPALSTMASAGIQTPTQPPNNVQRLPANSAPPENTPVTTPETPPEPTPQESPEMLEQLALLQKWTPTLNILINAASQGAEPEIYANYLLDQIPLEDINDFLNNDDAYEKLFVMVEQVKPFKKWFDECRVLVLHYINEDKQEQETAIIVPPETEPAGEKPNYVPEAKPDVQLETPANDGEQHKEDIPGESSSVISGDTVNTSSTES